MRFMTHSETQTIKVLTVQQAADALHCSKTHIYRLIHSGALETVDISKPGSQKTRMRILMEDLNEFITSSGKRK